MLYRERIHLHRYKLNVYNYNFVLIEQQLSIPPSAQLLATTMLLSVSMSLTILDISYQWNHEAFVPL